MSIVTKTVRTVKVTKTVRTERTVKVKRTTKGKPNGVILYRGPSLLDGSPIVVVAVGLKTKSKNAKTGDMIGTYVLADGDDNPLLRPTLKKAHWLPR